jgi:hypothetical protein
MDMMLDTITNMFGGIMFIAILLCLLTGGQAGYVTQQAATSAAHVVSLQTDFDEAKAEAARKLDLSVYLENLIGEPDTKWSTILTRISADLDAAKTRLSEAKDALAKMQDKQNTVDQKMHVVAKGTSDLKREVEQLEKEIQREQSVRKLNARLPLSKATQLRPVHIVLSSDRLYILDGQDGGFRPVIAPTQRDIDYIKLGDGCTHVKLRQGAGTQVDERLGYSARWTNLRNLAPRDSNFLYMIVLPDSYDAFLTVRQIAVASGYDYDVIPLSLNSNVILCPGTGFVTQ